MAILKPQHLAELRRLDAQSRALLEALSGIDPSFTDSASSMTEVLERTVLVQDLRGMREAARDIRGLMSAVPPAQREQVLKHVREATGHPLEIEDAIDAAAAGRIITAGRIRNDREFYLLRSYLSTLEGIDTSADERSAVQSLLDAYRRPNSDAV